MLLKELLTNTKGQFISVTFTKKDGTLRKLVGRFGVTKHLSGGERKNTNDRHLIIYDVQKKGYRTINVDAVQTVKVGGKNYKVDENKVYLEIGAV